MTKYVNFGNGNAFVYSNTKGVGTGFYVTPYLAPSVLRQFRFGTADDLAERDPLTVSIEGSNYTTTSLTYGFVWTLIYKGSCGLNNVTSRRTFGGYVNVENRNAYDNYRILIQSQRGSANSVQYSELHLFGWY